MKPVLTGELNFEGRTRATELEDRCSAEELSFMCAELEQRVEEAYTGMVILLETQRGISGSMTRPTEKHYQDQIVRILEQAQRRLGR